MTDFHCDNCEFLQDKSNDNLIDGYCKKYNQSLNFYDWWEKCDNCVIETLKAENAALRERLEKAVELREPRITVDHWGGLYEVVYEKVQVVSEVYETRSEAEVRVAELKGEGKNE